MTPKKEGGESMRPLKRFKQKKHKSVREFRKKAGRTKAANVNTSPMRGGIRL